MRSNCARPFAFRKKLPSQLTPRFAIAISAIKVINIAVTLIVSCQPTVEPFAAASRIFASSMGTTILISPRVSGSPRSGTMTLAMMNAAGADSTDADIKCAAMFGKYPTSIRMYAPRTPPAVFANPPTIMAMSSDRVIFSMKGRTTRGASVCPTKILAELDSDSAPDTRIVCAMILAKSKTIFCIMPR